MAVNGKERSRVFHAYLRGETTEERKKALDAYCEESAWLIGQEETGSHGMEHWQVTFGFKNARFLNAVQKKLPQGENIQVVRDPKASIKYCSDELKRSGDICIYGDVPDFGRVKVDHSDMLQEATEAGTYEGAMALIKEKDLGYYVLNQKKLSAYFTSEFAEPDLGKYPIEAFSKLPINIPENKTLVFVGPTRIGKTQFALAHFKSPIIIRGKQDWCRFRAGITDGVVLDDIAFRKWTPETLLHTMERETAYTADVKYGSVRIPAGLPKIVCINSMQAFWPDNILEATKEAIEARIEIHEFFGPLYKRKGAIDYLEEACKVARIEEEGFCSTCVLLDEKGPCNKHT